MPKLAVIPSDPMSAYEAVGCHVWAKGYYNPGGAFDEVFLFSPLEKREQFQYGMHTIPTQPRELASRIRQYKVDLIRAYGGYWACDMACKNKVKNVPVVVSVHDTNPDELYPSISQADYVFCMSQAVRELVLTRHPDPQRVWILPNRYDKKVMRPLPDEDFSDLDKAYPWKYKLLCVGRISRQKNQDNVVKALKELGPDYGCLFVGRNDTDPIQKAAEEAGVSAQCRFVESIRNDLLPRYYNWADAMFTPSRWEGFGIVFIEALACGAVVVTSDVRPMSEYIQHEQNGLLVREHENPKALAAMVERACTDEALRKTLRKNAPESVAAFEKERVDGLEIQYYQRILSESRNRQIGANFIKRLKKAFHGDGFSIPEEMEQGGPARAKQWIFFHVCPGAGMPHSPQLQALYPEVTGYYIPTLLQAGEKKLAFQFAKWLVHEQKEDGSWNGVDCEESYSFDTGQILKGLVAILPLLETEEAPGNLTAEEVREALNRGCDWLVAQMEPSGRITTPSENALALPQNRKVPEAFYLYCLSPLRDAAEILERSELAEAAEKALNYYKHNPDLGVFNTLSHFHAYVIEALVDLGERELAQKRMDEIAALQRPDGSVPAWPDVDWVCSTGLAQYALIWAKLGQEDRAKRAFFWLCAHQNHSGGFYGGYGKGADYFPDAEISWAVKYYLDAWMALFPTQ